MSKTSIASTPHYELSVLTIKNRAYLKIAGFWRNPEAVPNYLEDWQKAVSMLRKGFTLLTDVTEMAIAPASVRAIHQQAQQLIVQAGVSKVAELHKSKITELQLDGVAGETKMPKKNFNDEAEAEKWLSVPVMAV